MPIFFQQQINEVTRMGIWKIEETESYFSGNVPVHRDVTHPHKRLQHLAGRFMLQFLFPDFPYSLIQVAETNKPFIPDDSFHFSISHCGDYAAAIVSRSQRVGIDIEIPVEKVSRVRDKFLSPEEIASFDQEENRDSADPFRQVTRLWSAKEAVFKWYGNGGADFTDHIILREQDIANSLIKGHFALNNTDLEIGFRDFDQLVLAWIVN